MAIRVLRRFVAYVTLRASRLHYLNVLSRLASFGLTAVLIFSTVFGIDSFRRATLTSDSVRRAELLNKTFRMARYAVAGEESLERKYRLEPGPAVFDMHRARGYDLVRAMRGVRGVGDAPDLATAQYVLREHALYLDATKQMFAAVDRGDTARATALDHGSVDPVYARIQGATEERAKAHELIAEAAIAQLGETQRKIIEITIFLSALGLLTLGIFIVVVLAYKKLLSASYQAEIDKLEEAVSTDNLTGLGNYRAYQEELELEVSRARRYGETLTLALLDIDDFKVVNDRYGRLHGDNVLTALAALLGSLRLEDRAYRVGGDEFAVVLPHTSLQAARETMQRLRSDVQGNLFGCTLSIGFATLKGVACSAEALLAQADAALYAGKRSGRDGLTAYDAALGDMWLRLPKKIQSLHELIAAGSVHMVFQAIWDVGSGRILAYEALARPDAKYGFDGPQEAFDLAERTGRAHELDAVCRASALASAAELPDRALLFLNVSPQSLDHGRLDPLRFVRAVRAAGLTPERVVVEITERSITRVDAVIDAARELQKQGFRLALDDTGAGNSGLEILSRLSLEFVKIDREVIIKAPHDKNARAVLAGIAAIAQATDAYVIAEGIENREILDFVCHSRIRQSGSSRGIHGVQGYLLQPPADDFAKFGETEDASDLLRPFSVDGLSKV